MRSLLMLVLAMGLQTSSPVPTKTPAHVLHAPASFQWGLPGDVSVHGDFDGDGVADLAVYRPSTGTWWILFSRTHFAPTDYQSFQWGLPGDVPMAGDYDGDGITDLAVYRPSEGRWYINYSNGYSWDVPCENAGCIVW